MRRIKGITITCASHSSTAVYSSSNPASGGRAIDRHNPTITAGVRGAIETPAAPKPSLSKKKASKKNVSNPLDPIAIKGGGIRGCLASKSSVDYLSPPPSSRYLLEDNKESGSGFLDALSDLEPGLELKVLPASHEAAKAKPEDFPLQVVVLRVSLHCRGCEGKVRKHIARMQGVTSFSIDFFAKKVTIVGDMTPLEVLAAVSKVKNAQLWPPPSASVVNPTKY